MGSATEEPNATGEGESALTASNRGSEPSGANVPRETDLPTRTNAHPINTENSVVNADCESEGKVDVAQPDSHDAREEQVTAVAPEVSSSSQPDTPHGHGVFSQERDDYSTGEAHALAGRRGPAMARNITTSQQGVHQGAQQGSHSNVSLPAVARGAGVDDLSIHLSVRPPQGHVFHTRGKMKEFRVLVGTVITTPRKLKRAFNIYVPVGIHDSVHVDWQAGA